MEVARVSWRNTDIRLLLVSASCVTQRLSSLVSKSPDRYCPGIATACRAERPQNAAPYAVTSCATKRSRYPYWKESAHRWERGARKRWYYYSECDRGDFGTQFGTQLLTPDIKMSENQLLEQRNMEEVITRNGIGFEYLYTQCLIWAFSKISFITCAVKIYQWPTD